VGTAVIAAKPPAVKLKAALNHGGKVTEAPSSSTAMSLSVAEIPASATGLSAEAFSGMALHARFH